jgi:cell division protein WhiA
VAVTVKASFTDEVKAELANVQPARPCCQQAELMAIAEALAGSGDGRLTLRIPRNAVARKVVHLAKVAGGRVETVRKGATDKRPSYRLRLTLPSGRGSQDACCARAILRGAFLARGLLGNPADAYHLEMALPEDTGAHVNAGAARAGISLKRTARRGRAVYYLKGAEPISRMLSLMGANRAVMRFEHDRILREMRSQANRRANSETANLDKRLRAALQQREAIRRLKARDSRLQSLPPALREMAELRLAHPRAGLRELAELTQLSKSAIANRLRRLVLQAN